jgi:O-antigen/teichoic acid export membrane protein
MSESANTTPSIHPSPGARIVRGTVSAFALNVLTYGCIYIGQVLIVRLLPMSEYAEYTVSISFVAILSLVADLGMNPLFTRLFAEAEEDVSAHKQDHRGTLLGSALVLRILLSVLTACLLFIVAPLLYPTSMVHTMSILLISLVVSSRMLIVRSVGEAVLRGRGKYYLAALFALFDAIAFAILMVIATYRKIHLDEVIWIYTLSNIPGFLMLAWSVWKWVQKEKITVQVKLSSMVDMIKISLPLALGTAFLTIHTQIDNLLLDKLSTPLEVSSYGATIRLSAAMAPFSLVLAAVTSPELTKLLRREDHSRAKQMTSISLRLLLVVGAAIALVVTSLSGLIVPLMLGTKYASASSLLIWTGWMLIPIFIGTLLMDISIAAGKTWFMTANAGICMVAVIIGDLILIPIHGAAGAMASKLIAVTLGAGAVIWLSRNTGHLDSGRLVSALLRTGLAAGAALGAFWTLRSWSFNEILSALLMLAVYYLVIHFTRVLPLEEIVSLVKRIRLPSDNTSA